MAEFPMCGFRGRISSATVAARLQMDAALQRCKDKIKKPEGLVNYFNKLLARRAVIKGAGLGVVAGGLANALPVQNAVAAEGGEIWSSEYWTKKGDVPLWMFRKRLGAPKPG